MEKRKRKLEDEYLEDEYLENEYLEDIDLEGIDWEDTDWNKEIELVFKNIEEEYQKEMNGKEEISDKDIENKKKLEIVDDNENVVIEDDEIDEDDEINLGENFEMDISLDNKMMIKHNHSVSYHGINFDELKSFLQKSIRTGNVKDCIWISKEITYFWKAYIGEIQYKAGINSKLQEQNDTKKTLCGMITNCLNRILVTYLEDIETGYPQLKQKLERDMKRLMDLKKDKKKILSSSDFEKYLTRILIDICNAPKRGRIYSLVKSCWNARDTEPRGWKEVLKIPGMEKIATIFSQHEQKNPKKIAKILEELGLKKNDERSKSLQFWYKNIPNKECWLALASHHINPILMKFQNQPIIRSIEEIDESKLKLEENYFPKNINDPSVLDRHTRNGKNSTIDKGFSRFALLGSLVKNELHILPPICTKIYVEQRLPGRKDGKKWDIYSILEDTEVSEHLCKNGYSESLLIRFHQRPQVTCSNARSDTYFGYMWGFPVFVKGPFQFGMNMENYSIAHELKICLGLNSIKPKIIDLIPDRWESKIVPEEGNPIAFSSIVNEKKRVPVGFRNKIIDVNQKYKFIIFESEIPDVEELYPIPHRKYSSVSCTGNKESKWNPDLPITDWKFLATPSDNYPRGIIGHPVFEKMNDLEKYQYIDCQIWRYVAGVPDPAQRNYVWSIVKEKIMSVDEDGVFSKTANPVQARFEKLTMNNMAEFCKKNWNLILNKSQVWIQVLEKFKMTIPKNQMIENVKKLFESEESFCNILFVKIPTNKKQKKE